MRAFACISLIAAVVAASLAAAPQSAEAQASSFDAPPVGARVRVSRIGVAPMTGTVLSRASDSIVVGDADGRRETLAMKDVTGLQISRGRLRNVAVGTAVGLVAGAVGGVALRKRADRVTVTGVPFKSTDPNNLYLQAAPAADTTVGSSMWIPLGALAGTATGTLVGYLWKERWRPAAVRRGDARVGLVPTPDSRRVALALSARF